MNKAQGGSKKISSKPLIKISKADRKTLKENENEILRLKKENERIAMENEILKKLLHIHAGTKTIIKFIYTHKDKYPVKLQCRVL